MKDLKTPNPKFPQGTIALCQHGHLGLIVTPHGGAEPNHPAMYRGIHLGKGKEGQPWESRQPVFICHVDELVRNPVATVFHKEMLCEPPDPSYFGQNGGVNPGPTVGTIGGDFKTDLSDSEYRDFYG